MSGPVQLAHDWQRRLLAPFNRYDPQVPPNDVPLSEWLGAPFLRDAFGRRVHRWQWTPPEIDWSATVELLCERLEPSRVMVLDAQRRRKGVDEGFDSEVFCVLRDVHTHLVMATRLQVAFRHLFRCPVTTGLYRNGVGAIGFEEHHDAHHVFAWQLSGTKRWWLAEPTVFNVHRRYLHASEAVAHLPVDLTPGGLLYLPPGVRHRAECLDGTSLHLTFGVHTPSRLEAIEALLEGFGAFAAQLRAPLAREWTTDGVEYRLNRNELSALLRQAADSLGPNPSATRLGVALAFAPEPEPPPVLGEWPVREGFFVRQQLQGEIPDKVRMFADELLQALPRLESVYLRGSAFSEADPTPISDIDLVLVFPGEPSAEEAERVRECMTKQAEPWDLRIANGAALRAGSGPPYLHLCLPIASMLIAGKPIWEQEPLISASHANAVVLFQEAAEAWTRLAQWPSAELPVAAAPWMQRRALRFAGIQLLARRGAFTRHPWGCVEACRELHPDLREVAARVCQDLFEGRTDDAAVVKAKILGDQLCGRGLPWPPLSGPLPVSPSP